jgi:hypothetical protein
VHTRSGKDLGSMTLEQALELIQSDIAGRGRHSLEG